MAFTLYKPVHFQEATLIDDTWALVRGISQTYDVQAQFTVAHTGWSLVNAPSGFSINRSGVITADIPHNFTGTVGDLTISTNQGFIILHTTIRDWFPNDHPTPIRAFYSSWRSYDGTSRTLFTGRYHHGTNLVSSQDLIIASAADGYLNVDALETTLANIAQDGVLIVTQWTDQVGDFNLIPVSNTELLAIHMEDGEISRAYTSGNNRLMLEGIWSPGDLDSNWSSATDRTYADYASSSTASVATGAWGITCLLEKKSPNSSNRRLRAGDGNSVPAVRNSNSGYRLQTAPLQPPNSVISVENVSLLIGQNHLSTATHYSRRLSRYDLTTEVRDVGLTSSLTPTASDLNGTNLEVAGYYIGEFAVWDAADTQDASLEWVRNDHEIANNLLAAFSNNQTITYTS